MADWQISTLVMLEKGEFLFDSYLIAAHKLPSAQRLFADFLFDWQLANWPAFTLFMLDNADFLFDGHLIVGQMHPSVKHKSTHILCD